MTVPEKNALAMNLFIAWNRYVDLFGRPPHGTHVQMQSLVELIPHDSAHAGNSQAVTRAEESANPKETEESQG